jgi:hypothetical protein
MKNKPAGGPGSRVVKKVAAPKTEPKSRAMNPKGVSQLGNLVGNHVMERGKPVTKSVEPLAGGRGYNPPSGVNLNAKPTIYGNCGTQGAHGPAAAGMPSASRDILSEFGPESKR